MNANIGSERKSFTQPANFNENLQEEAAFADAEYSALVEQHGLHIDNAMFTKYSSPTNMWDWRQKAAQLLGNIANRSLLDYGCGQGEESVYFARLGARVTAIDISTQGIAFARSRAQINGLAERIDCRVMDALEMDLPDESFDVVHGMGILHHVGLEKGLRAIHRVLRTGGYAVFLEPLGSSYTIEACKRSVHSFFGKRLGLRPTTSGEENLKLRQIHRAIQYFSRGEVYPYHLIHRVRKLCLPMSWYNAALVIDYQLLRTFSILGHFSGAAVIRVYK